MRGKMFPLNVNPIKRNPKANLKTFYANSTALRKTEDVSRQSSSNL